MGGTSEARKLCHQVSERKTDAIVSFAGRVTNIESQPLPTRTGGFGGVLGLVDFIVQRKISHLVDATHPFSANISENAIEAARLTGVRFATLERPAWVPCPDDNWFRVKSVEEAIDTLSDQKDRIFLAIGRKNILGFLNRKANFYLLRVVETAPEISSKSDYKIIYGKGPYKFENDKKILIDYNITKIIAKNSGGVGSRAKIDAARVLEIPVVMIDRPKISYRKIFETVEETMDWLFHPENRGV